IATGLSRIRTVRRCSKTPRVSSKRRSDNEIDAADVNGTALPYVVNQRKALSVPSLDTHAHPMIASPSSHRSKPTTSVERALLEAHVGDTYQVVREIGRGGMGVVFLARDVMLHRLVAIKVLRHEIAGSRSEEHTSELQSLAYL